MKASWFLMLQDQVFDLEPWPDERFPPSPYYGFLRLLAANAKPRLSVELGLAGGGGSFHLCEGWPAGTVVGVERAEPDDQQRDNWHFLQCRHPNFVLWRGDSVESADRIAATYGEVDVIFFDTTHEYEQTAREWAAWEPHLRSRCVACFDDLDRPGVGRFWGELAGDKVRLDWLKTYPGGGDGGFGVWWRDG